MKQVERETRRHRIQSGFAVIELVVVIGIVGLLTSVTWLLLSKPSAPTQPFGPTRGEVNVPHTFAAMGTFSGTVKAYFEFDWGDGTKTKSLKVGNGNSLWAESKTWSEPGTYKVRARTLAFSEKPLGLGVSKWSEPLEVVIVPLGEKKEPIWEYDPKGYPEWAPALSLDGGTVYQTNMASKGHPNGQLYALSSAGTYKWTYPAGVGSPVVGPNGVIYALAGFDLLALKPDGSLHWSRTLDAQCNSCIAADNLYVYVGLHVGSPGESQLLALDQNGQTMWESPIGQVTVTLSPPALAADGTIYLATGKAAYAFNPDGTLKWTCSEASWPMGVPAIGEDGSVYFASGKGNLYCIAASGALKWSFHDGPSKQDVIDYVLDPVIGKDGMVYFGNHYLYAVNPDGTLNWKFDAAGDESDASIPAIGSDGTIYFGTSAGYVYALDPDGSVKWRYDPTKYVSSTLTAGPATIGPDGTVYVGIFEYIKAYQGTGKPASGPWPMYGHDPQHTAWAKSK